MIEISGELGFDFVWIDLEHTEWAFSFPALNNSIRTAEAVGISTIVRVPDNDKILIRLALEAGAEGVIIPHISTKEDTIQAVQAMKFPPEGVRGASSSLRRPVAWGTYGIDPKLYKEANENVLPIILIEDQLGYDNIEEILSVKGVGAVFPGPRDYSFSLGLWGVITEEINESRRKVMAAAKRKGIAVYTSLEPALVKGYDKDPVEASRKFIKNQGKVIVGMGGDIGFHLQGCRKAKDMVDNIKKGL